MADPQPKAGASANAASPDLVVIKKYANRRLYNTDSSSYVTLEHLSEMVREGRDFIVQDAKSGEDITRAVLTQIIFEQENSGGQTLLPTQFLRRLIRYYGDQMQSFVPSYLEASIEAFARSQEQWRDQISRAWGGVAPIPGFEEQARQNLQMFEQAMRVWAPFATPPVGMAPPRPDAEAGNADPDTITDLRRQMEAMQRQLDQLAQSRKQ